MTENANAAVHTQSILGRQGTMILLLAVVGAGLDAVMLLAFGVLTAAQTGNTILLSVAVGQGRWDAGLAAGISVIGYVVGSGVGELIVEGNRARGGPPLVARALVLELLLLTLVLVGWRLLGADLGSDGQEVLVALAAMAMGVQSTVTLHLHAGPMTTYVTGTLTTFTTGIIRRLRRGGLEPGAALARPGAGLRSSTQVERPWMYGVTWSAYATSAVVTSLLYLASHEAALLLPIGILGGVVVAAYTRRDVA